MQIILIKTSREENLADIYKISASNDLRNAISAAIAIEMKQLNPSLGILTNSNNCNQLFI